MSQLQEPKNSPPTIELKKIIPVLIYVLNLGVIAFFWWHGSGYLLSSNQLNLILLALARLMGLLGMFSVLVQYTLISHNPLLERAWPYLKLTKLHQYNGIFAFSLITTHILLMVTSFKLAGAVSPITLPWVWLAAIAYTIMLITVGSSLLWWAGKLSYRIWVPIHICNYFVVPLAFWHQVTSGSDLLTNDTFRIYWYIITVLALLNLTIFRVLKPHQRLRLH